MNYFKKAIIVPVYKQKFNYLMKFIDSLTCKDHVYFIFTNAFEHLYCKCMYGFNCNFFILEDYFDKDQIASLEKKFLLPSFKKLFFVSKLIQDYEYIISLDDDFLIIKEDLLIEACKSFSENKNFIGGLVEFETSKTINQTSLSVLSHHKHYTNLKNDEKLNIYYWLSEIPIYERKSTLHFLDFIDIEGKFYEFFCNVDFHFFDTVAYNYFCALEYNYTIQKIDWNFSLEDCPLEVWNSVNSNVKKLYSINHNIYNNQDIALLIHTDRKDGQSYKNANKITDYELQ